MHEKQLSLADNVSACSIGSKGKGSTGTSGNYEHCPTKE